MIYLLLAIASSACVSIFMRLSEGYIKSEMGMFMANYGACIALSLAFMEGSVGETMSHGTGAIITLGCITGILYLSGFMVLKYNIKHNGLVLASTFMKLGVLIPTVMAVIFFGEKPEGLQILGIVLALAAIVTIQFEKEAIKDGHKKIWLLVILIVSGLGDGMMNVFEQAGVPEGKDGYLLMTFAMACLLTVVLVFAGREKIGKKDLTFGLLIGVPNYFSARFLLLALSHVDAVIAYPVYSVATLVVITLAGIVGFREKLSKKKAAALVMILISLALLNL